MLTMNVSLSGLRVYRNAFNFLTSKRAKKFEYAMSADSNTVSADSNTMSADSNTVSAGDLRIPKTVLRPAPLDFHW